MEFVLLSHIFWRKWRELRSWVALFHTLIYYYLEIGHFQKYTIFQLKKIIPSYYTEFCTKCYASYDFPPSHFNNKSFGCRSFNKKNRKIRKFYSINVENRCIELVTYMNNTKVSKVEASKVHLIFLISSLCYMYCINRQLICIIFRQCKWFCNM